MVSTVGRHVPDAAFDARFRKTLDLARLSLRVVGDGNRPTPGGSRHLLQLGNPLHGLSPVRHPAVGVADDPLENLPPAAPYQDRRLRLRNPLAPPPPPPPPHPSPPLTPPLP